MKKFQVRSRINERERPGPVMFRVMFLFPLPRSSARLRRFLGNKETLALRIVIEQFGVAPPIDGGLELPDGFLFGEMLVQNVVKEIVGERVVGLGFQGAFDLLKQRDVFERGVAEKFLLAKNVGVGKLQPAPA